MEFVNRVKQRLAEFEGDPEDYPDNDTSEDIECLKSETVIKTAVSEQFDRFGLELDQNDSHIDK